MAASNQSGGNSNRIAVVFFVGAIVVAGAALYGIFSILGSYRKAAQFAEKPVETVTVVAASRVLYQGVGITTDDLFVVNVPPDYLPVVKKPDGKDVVKVETFQSRERVVGQVPRERILANEFIRPERLADGNSGIGLNAVIPRGMRAISVRLQGADAVSGFLTPGNYVDVLVTMKDELGGRRTETILQAVFVLGVNSRAQNEDAKAAQGRKSAPSVTFLVTPKQAEDIAYADEIGQISLTLRNVQDVNYTQLTGADLDALLSRLAPKVHAEQIKPVDTRPVPVVVERAPEVPVVQGPTIRIVRGSSATEIDAEGGN